MGGAVQGAARLRTARLADERADLGPRPSPLQGRAIAHGSCIQRTEEEGPNRRALLGRVPLPERGRTGGGRRRFARLSAWSPKASLPRRSPEIIEIFLPVRRAVVANSWRLAGGTDP